MEIRLPAKFEKQTRWGYMKGGIEYGPFSAPGIVELMRSETIDADTDLVELSTRKLAPLQSIGPFADAFKLASAEVRKKKARAEVEKTRFRMIGRARLRVWARVLGLLRLPGLVRLGAVLFDPFAKGEEAKIISVEPVKEETQVVEKTAESEDEPVIHEAAVDDMALDEAAELAIVARLKKENQLIASTASIGMDIKRNVELPKVKAIALSNGGQAGVGNGTLNGQAGQAGGGGVETLDFSEDEDVDSRDSPVRSQVDSLRVAKERFNKVVKSCVQRTVMNNDDIEGMSVDASCRLDPDGHMRGVRLDARPNLHTGELKMCVSADLAANAVPAYSGDAIAINTRVTVGTVNP